MNKLTTLALGAALAFTLTGCPKEGAKTGAPAGDAAKTAAEGAADAAKTGAEGAADAAKSAADGAADSQPAKTGE